MATFKICIIKHRMKPDNTWNVKIRLTHFRDQVYIGTKDYVDIKSLDKNKDILQDCSAYARHLKTIQGYRRILDDLGDAVEGYTAEQIANLLRRVDKQEIDFLVFMITVIENIRKQGRKKTADSYQTSKNHLIAYSGLPVLWTSMLTSNFLKEFDLWLREHKGLNKKDKPCIVTMGDAGVNKVMSNVRATFNLAKLEYNNYDIGDIQIKNDPFMKYKLPKVGEPEYDRNLEVPEVRKIRDIKPELAREILARDVFMISFYLMGTNCIDLYLCLPPVGDRLVYNRTKTKDRKEDKAKMSIRIEPELVPYLEKYKGKKYAFDFTERYSSSQSFIKNMDIGLKEIGKDLKLNLPTNLTSYYARHSWASIAANDCDVPTDIISKSLSHSSSSDELKITNKYIKKSYKKIDDANRKVLDQLKMENLK